MKKLLFLLIIVMLIAGCATPPPEPTSTPLPPTEIPPTPTPEPTNTSIPPTQISPTFEVMFDGNDCILTGPTEVPSGEHTFAFIDQGETRGQLWLNNIPEDKTLQDLLDRQSEPGESFGTPSWFLHDERVSLTSGKKNNDRRVDYSIWALDKVGEHIVICYVANPPKLWLTGPIFVVETPSD